MSDAVQIDCREKGVVAFGVLRGDGLVNVHVIRPVRLTLLGLRVQVDKCKIMLEGADNEPTGV